MERFTHVDFLDSWWIVVDVEKRVFSFDTIYTSVNNVEALLPFSFLRHLHHVDAHSFTCGVFSFTAVDTAPRQRKGGAPSKDSGS